MGSISRYLNFVILIVWLYASYQNIIYRIERNGYFNLYILVTGILIPPGMFILAGSILFLFIAYVDFGSKCIEKIIRGESLDFGETLWLFSQF